MKACIFTSAQLQHYINATGVFSRPIYTAYIPIRTKECGEEDAQETKASRAKKRIKCSACIIGVNRSRTVWNKACSVKGRAIG